MLLLKSKAKWKEIIDREPTFIVLPASDKENANDLAVSARIAEHSVRVLQSPSDDLFVCVLDVESRCVGFARATIREAGLPWFLFRHSKSGQFVQELLDGSRLPAVLTGTGFTLNDGKTSTVASTYHPAQNNTAWLHSTGGKVGPHL